MIELDDKRIDSLEELDKVNDLATKYKGLNHQLSNVIPKVTHLSGSSPKSHPTSVYFDEDVRQAITECGQRELQRLRLALIEYGIKV